MCQAHTKKLDGKPFDLILVKTKNCNARATRYRVDMAIELEPVNAVNRFHRQSERE